MTFLSSNLQALSSTVHIEHHETGPWQVLVESNLLNVLILLVAIVYLANKFLPKIIETRRLQISKELENAKEARIKAEEELETIKQKSKNISFEIEGIRNEAEKTAYAIRKSIENETEKEIEMLKLKVRREITSAQDKAIQEIQKSATEAAIKMAEEAIVKISKNEGVQKKLVDDFLAGLDKPSKN